MWRLLLFLSAFFSPSEGLQNFPFSLVLSSLTLMCLNLILSFLPPSLLPSSPSFLFRFSLLPPFLPLPPSFLLFYFSCLVVSEHIGSGICCHSVILSNTQVSSFKIFLLPCFLSPWEFPVTHLLAHWCCLNRSRIFCSFLVFTPFFFPVSQFEEFLLIYLQYYWLFSSYVHLLIMTSILIFFCDIYLPRISICFCSTIISVFLLKFSKCSCMLFAFYIRSFKLLIIDIVKFIS